jgi:hypothetical protein
MCCVMPPLSPLTTLMPMILSSSDVLPWSTWPRKVIDRRPRDERLFRIDHAADFFEELVFEALRRLEVDRDPELGGDELGHVGIHLSVESRHGALAHQDPQNIDAGHALADGAGELNADPLFTRRGRTNAGATLRTSAARTARGTIVVAGTITGAATGQLTLFASAQQRAPFAWLAANHRLAATSSAALGGLGCFFLEGFRLLRGVHRVFMPTEMGRQRLAAALAGAHRVGRQFHVGLHHLFAARLAAHRLRRLDGRHRRQLDGWSRLRRRGTGRLAGVAAAVARLRLFKHRRLSPTYCRGRRSRRDASRRRADRAKRGASGSAGGAGATGADGSRGEPPAADSSTAGASAARASRLALERLPPPPRPRPLALLRAASAGWSADPRTFRRDDHRHAAAGAAALTRALRSGGRRGASLAGATSDRSP